MQKILIKSKTITLVQLLKFEGFINTGGMFDSFEKENIILINGIKVTAKRQKLKIGDKITLNNKTYILEING